jgi:hypothetical protein
MSISIHILEATIAVLIVAGVMVSVYSEQSAREVLSVEDYSYSLQNEILEEIATRSDLRSDAMKVIVDLPGDPAYDVLDAFVETKVPEDFGHLLRVCNLGDPNDYCKMPQMIFYATMDKDVFVEDVVISAEVGDGTKADYSPKKVRLFLWEGESEDYCRDECYEDRAPLSCSTDFSQVLRTECGEFDMTDECVEYGPDTTPIESCGEGEFCTGGACVESLYSKVTCKLWTSLYEDACDVNPVVFCAGHDGWWESGDCHHGDDDEYSCYDYLWETSQCSLTPTCPSGYTLDSVTPCICVDVWTPSPDSVCSGTFFNQTSNCGNVRPVAGTKDCACVPTSWTPLTSEYCAGVPFTQTSDCGTTRSAMGTKNCVASLSLDFSNINYAWVDPYHYYYHTRTFTGSNGVGVTLTNGELCAPISGCTPYTFNYRIDAGSSLDLNNQNFRTTAPSSTFTVTYMGTDDNNNPVSVQGIVSVAGSSWISP